MDDWTCVVVISGIVPRWRGTDEAIDGEPFSNAVRMLHVGTWLKGRMGSSEENRRGLGKWTVPFRVKGLID